MIPTKPSVKLVGADGNIFNLVGLARQTLKKAGKPEAAAEMAKRVMSSHSYGEALNIIGEYCEIR